MKKLAFSVLATGSIALLLNVTDAEASSYTAKPGDSLWKIASSNNVSVADLKKWNGLTSDAIFANQVLKLAPSTANPAQPVKVAKPAQQQAASTATYTVKSGDTLSRIALLHKTTVGALQKLNNLDTAHIFAGQQLKVASTASPAIAKKPAAQQAPAPVAASTTYKVVKGDTVSGIAKRHGITAAQVMEWNKLSSANIRVGQVLKVKAPAAPAKTAPGPKPVPASAPVQPAKSYKVVKGDTVSNIAKRHGITAAQLMSWNKLTSANIYIGQVLIVKAAAAPAAKPAPVPASSPVQTNGTYQVVKGDTLSSIALRHGISMTQLMNWNNMTSTNIRIGQNLKVVNAAVAPQPPTAPVSAPTAIGKGSAGEVVSLGLSLVGTPYVWGGSSVNGFDCSGFIYYVYSQAGVQVSRTDTVGFEARSYDVSTPQVGDLVFFSNTYKAGISHMGIYIGDNKFVHAGGDRVQITNLNDVYWGKHFDGFKRLYTMN